MTTRSPEHAVLASRIRARQALVVVVGLGFVGTPEAVAIVRAGFRVVGIDRDVTRIARLQDGQSGVPDVFPADLIEALDRGALAVTNDWIEASQADVIVICVPTPLDAAGEPDLSAVSAAIQSIVGLPARPRLVVLASTVPPGATRAVARSGLTDAGYVIGQNAFLGFAPERLDPGNRRFTLANTPRLVAGISEACASLTEELYRLVVADVRRVSSPEVAEMAKAVENTFRYLNISFANELALLCDRLALDPWEVVDAAASKPFAFLPHYPGPGVGGSCIPVVPHYLQAVARKVGAPARLVDAATTVDREMPAFVVAKLERILAERGVPIKSARILVVGAAYKPDVADVRNTPAIPVIELLRAAGATVAYHDDLVPRLKVAGEILESEPLDGAWADADCHVLLTLHSPVDRERLVRNARLIFDTRNALGGLGFPNVVRL
jgi:UDP-N-acetyl-D-glucosamine dehydrogenase